MFSESAAWLCFAKIATEPPLVAANVRLFKNNAGTLLANKNLDQYGKLFVYTTRVTRRFEGSSRIDDGNETA